MHEEKRNQPQAIFEQYRNAVSYNHSVGLYETVKKNENFFIGNQWEGVSAPDLEKSVYNILKRVVLYFISNIVSDDIAADVSLFGAASPEQETILRIVSGQFDRIIENSKVKSKNRLALRNCAVDGDACFYMQFNPDLRIGGENYTQGDIFW